MTTDNPAASPEIPAAAPAQESTRQGPGRIIRQARERARLSAQELASHTKLARATVDAIERDDFAMLNEPVYVRGYYRKCAKVLNLPEADLLAAYERLAMPKAPPPPTKLLLSGGSSGLNRPLGRPSRAAVPWRAVLILLIAAGVGAGLWMLRGSSMSATVPGIGVPDSHGAGPGQAPVALAAVPLPAASAAVEETVTAAAAEKPAVQPAAASAAPSASASAPLPAQPVPPPAPSLSTAMSAMPPAGGEVGASPGAEALSLSFKATSWVRVEDASGKVLLSGVIQSGDSHTLDGKPPYSVFLGNARGVTLEYQGKVLDTAPYVRENATARFTVP
jgi:cytoskeleton protein RodZ